MTKPFSSFVYYDQFTHSLSNTIHKILALLLTLFLFIFWIVTRKGTIEKFDYGNDEENNKHYGQPNPPQYIISNIPNNIPLFLGYGGADYLSDVNDVKTLLDKLQNHNPDKLVLQYTEDYAHADFVFGTNAKEIVYNPIMAFFKLN